jgi:hypothetical protein
MPFGFTFHVTVGFTLRHYLQKPRYMQVPTYRIRFRIEKRKHTHSATFVCRDYFNFSSFYCTKSISYIYHHVLVSLEVRRIKHYETQFVPFCVTNF